jgi:hypothetical protein
MGAAEIKSRFSQAGQHFIKKHLYSLNLGL